MHLPIRESDRLSYDSIEDFSEPFVIEHADFALPVYTSMAGTRPLIVLHELPGMTRSFIDYCSRMAQQGYRVYMPLLFKKPGTDMSALRLPLFCLSAEFRRLFAATPGAEGSRPFTKWLLKLTQDVAGRHPDKPIGIVGMCLTGNFAMAAIAEPQVAAAVLCQPSYPVFRNIASMGLSPDEREAAIARSGDLPRPCMKGYRYAGDWICRRRHMAAIEQNFTDAFERYPDLKGSAHSTLTTASRSEVVFDDVLAFLDARLRPDP